MKPTNLLYICSDQHNRAMLGCYGHTLDVRERTQSRALEWSPSW